MARSAFFCRSPPARCIGAGPCRRGNGKKSEKRANSCLHFGREVVIIAVGSALHDEGVIIHEERYSSVLRRSGCPLCLRRDLPHGFHEGRTQGRNLQQVPSVLHGPAEACGQRRTGRSLQEAVRHVISPLNHSTNPTKETISRAIGRFSFTTKKQRVVPAAMYSFVTAPTAAFSWRRTPPG